MAGRACRGCPHDCCEARRTRNEAPAGSTIGSGSINRATAFDQSGRAPASRELEAQPERGFPTLAKENVAATKNAIKQYAGLVARGGWAQLPPIELRTGMNHPAVVQLRRRLQATGDLQAYGGYPEIYNSYVEQAVKKAQSALRPAGHRAFSTKTRSRSSTCPPRRGCASSARICPGFKACRPRTPAGKYIVVNIPCGANRGDQQQSGRLPPYGRGRKTGPAFSSGHFGNRRDQFQQGMVRSADRFEVRPDPQRARVAAQGQGCAGGA